MNALPLRKVVHAPLALVAAFTLALTAQVAVSPAPARAATIIVHPGVGKLYHGAYPGGVTGSEDDIAFADVASYETSVAHRVAWVYFSNNWYASRKFPWGTARMIRANGSVPFVRLMLRSGGDNPCPELVFKISRIIRGDFDNDLRRWFYSARRFGTPLIVEYGTEVTGEWFSWNGKWNGGGRTNRYGDPTKPDGPERFVAAYRRIITISRQMGATNIIWVFHTNWDMWPYARWNTYRNYYPGNSYIDWLAISAYGAQDPRETEVNSFRTMMDYGYPRLARVGPLKPVIVAEFGDDVRNTVAPAPDWTRAAIDDMVARRWPRLIGFSWWNERWQNDDDPAHDTTMRVQESPALAAIFDTELSSHSANIVFTPLTGARR